MVMMKTSVMLSLLIVMCVATKTPEDQELKRQEKEAKRYNKYLAGKSDLDTVKAS
jgi:hypothetical protein